MFDGLSADAHGVRPVIEPGLHPVEDVLVAPALQPLELVQGAFRLARAAEAGGQMTEVIDVVLPV